MLKRTHGLKLHEAVERARLDYAAELEIAQGEAEHAKNTRRQIERLQEQLRAAESLSRVHQERAAVLAETVEMLKEQNRTLVDTIRGPEIWVSNPLENAKRQLKMMEDEEGEEPPVDGPTLASRLEQYSDPGYVPTSIRERVLEAAARAAELNARQAEVLADTAVAEGIDQ